MRSFRFGKADYQSCALSVPAALSLLRIAGSAKLVLPSGWRDAPSPELRQQNAVVLFPHSADQPFLGLSDCFEVFGITTLGCALDLPPGQRAWNDECDPLGSRLWVGQNPLKFGDRVLLLDAHLGDVDKRQMLIWPALEFRVGGISRNGKCLNVSDLKKARHGDEQEAVIRVVIDIKLRRHCALQPLHVPEEP
ncbi:hypothetical protein [Sphingomonas melonis]|uniref:hypothetical protein n=1 Tax=Sphingomonas melonis TaxID=152682 RepID=UPI0015CAF77C|nr:hypothetical protein [Sphingomonas melonis]